MLSISNIISAEVAELYESSFPIEERRNLSAQQELLKCGALQLFIIEKEKQFAGFVFCWLLTDFIFIEHFAVAAQQRGNGIGSQVMGLLSLRYPQIVLEVEPPFTKDAERRIRFYEGLGFKAWEYEYLQPAYHAGSGPLSMLLMQKGMSPEKHTFQNITSEIYREVYGL